MPVPIKAASAVERLTPGQELAVRLAGQPAATMAALEAMDAEAGRLAAMFVSGALAAERNSRHPSVSAGGRAFQHARAVERIAQAQAARRR